MPKPTYEELSEALIMASKARDSYCNEFNPANKCKKVADWFLINEAWCKMDDCIKRLV